MDKALICKIVVTTKSGKRVRGTGYPVARDRIITAAHVVDDADKIELFFGQQNEGHPPEETPTVRWSGKVQGCNDQTDVDVAVIACQLPGELAPIGLLLAEGTIQSTEFYGGGFSTAGKTENKNGFYDFSGEFHLATGESHEHSVDCNNGPDAEDDEKMATLWGGASGASLFEKVRNRLLAVLTHHIPKYKLPRLRVVPLPFLLRDEGFRDAIRYGETADTKQRNAHARERLRVLAEPVLKSAVTREFILKCNNLTDAMSAKELAAMILDSPEPMSFLRHCVRKQENKTSFSADELAELNIDMCRLVELVAPVCFRQVDLEDLERHLNQQASHANMPTQNLTVAKSRIAFIKRVSVNLEDQCDWKTVDDQHFPGGRESVASMPHPPELGIYADGAIGMEDIVDTFTTVLIRMLNPVSANRSDVQAALEDHAESDKVFLCVLFPMRISDTNLARLHKAFPELILLVAEETTDDPSHGRVLRQIQLIRKEFGPQARKQA